jgi:hypothetical protein
VDLSTLETEFVSERVLIAIGVVIGKRRQSLGFTSLAHQPTGRLGCKQNQKYLDNRGNSLQQRWQAPGPCVINSERTERRPRGTVKDCHKENFDSHIT